MIPSTSLGERMMWSEGKVEGVHLNYFVFSSALLTGVWNARLQL